MKRVIGFVVVAATLALTTSTSAQELKPVRLLTGGIVKQVDPANRIIVLDNGHRVEASLVMVDGVHADIGSVRPGSHVMVSGVEIPEPRPAATQPR